MKKLLFILSIALLSACDTDSKQNNEFNLYRITEKGGGDCEYRLRQSGGAETVHFVGRCYKGYNVSDHFVIASTNDVLENRTDRELVYKMLTRFNIKMSYLTSQDGSKILEIEDQNQYQISYSRFEFDQFGEFKEYNVWSEPITDQNRPTPAKE